MDASATMCTVCVEPFTKVRKSVVCLHCKLECCTKCATTYLETSGVTPQCMQCHNLWSHQYIRENFGASFVKKMAEVRKNVLFNEQQALFPDTQEYVSLLNQFEELKQNEQDILTTHNCQIGENKHSIGYQRRMVGHRIQAIRNPIRGVNYPGEDNTTHTKQYIKPCGRCECKGYVNAENNTCELCKTEYCEECMEEKCEGHKCKPEDVSTVSMLRKDTKGCPKCAVPIHRISGCLDMFCVSCKTAFNWRTLQINDRGNTNPLYYQWLHDTTTQVATTASCGQTLRSEDMVRANNFRELHHTERNEVMHIIATLHHYEEGYGVKKFYKEYKKTKQYNHSFRMITLESRADYLNNKLSKEKFTQFLLKMNKAIEYNGHIDDIVNSIRQFRQHLLQTIVFSTDFDYETFWSESKNFIQYINQCVSYLEEVFYTKKDNKVFISITV